MSSTQFFPIPPEIFACACGTVTNRVSQLPFLRGGVNVTGEAIGIAMESLNAVPRKALAITTPQGPGGDREDGLDRCLKERLHIPGRAAAPVIADVLYNAGIAEPALITDRHAHRGRRGIRLLSPWTWHIASTLAPSVRLGGTGIEDPSLSWMDVCPVCRTGILGQITGKQLFGVPRTDFYMECSHCGAKFIPVGPAFRLVSIASIRDPVWKKHLDKTYRPFEWSVIARGAGMGGSPALRPALKKSGPSVLPAAAVTLTPSKDGSLAVPLPGKTLYFRPVTLHFAGGIREGAFARVQKTVEEVLGQPAFEHLRSPVNAKYSRYLSLKTGLFLSQLKERHDPFYREFLNPSGDGKYGTFKAEDSNDTEKKGIILVVVNRGLYHVINSKDSMCTTIGARFGRIGPDDCLLSGDPVRCRINTLLCTNKKEAGLYIHPVEDEDERLSITHAIEDLVTVGHT
jgi:hypothetical protein